MKCPFRFVVGQVNIYQPIRNDKAEIQGDYKFFIEKQAYGECYKENCADWDDEEKMCRKVGE